jgi:hypothetical protein
MNVELEGLVLALEAVIQARAGDEADRLDAVTARGWTMFCPDIQASRVRG